jgi:probable HAF family extracellular repeat protein
MRPIGFTGLALVTVAACDGPVRGTEPVRTLDAPVAAGTPQFTLRSLGTLGGDTSAAIAINEQSAVVGYSDVADGGQHAFLWRDGDGLRSLGTLGGANSRARAINDRTEVVGFSEIEPGSSITRAFLWTEVDGMRSLGTLGGANSAANAINNRGEVVGLSDTRQGDVRGFFLRPGGRMRALGTLGGAESRARVINDAGQVAGFSQTEKGEDHAFLWTAAGGMRDLGTLGGASSAAFGISQTGEIVGVSETAAGTEEAFLWTPATGMRSLGLLGRDPRTAASGVNAHRWVVGNSVTEADEIGLPFLWTKERGLQPLPTLGGGQGQARDVNEMGQIAGTSVAADGSASAALWVAR